ncbi:MAG: hypothetical protein HY554_01755 [Elusimicrobia bacterium]|nr:hypothetical protein [Elusimicrobiota bacterium]
MLSGVEREELLEMARSESLRRDFERLEDFAAREHDFEGYLAFLTEMARYLPARPAEPRVEYRNALL